MTARSFFFIAGLVIGLFAVASPAAASEDPVECLTGPHIPEAFVYYLAWECTVGGQIPEPIEATAGCTFGFPVTHINC